MDQRQRESNRYAGEADRRASMRRAENDDQEHERHDERRDIASGQPGFTAADGFAANGYAELAG